MPSYELMCYLLLVWLLGSNMDESCLVIWKSFHPLPCCQGTWGQTPFMVQLLWPIWKHTSAINHVWWTTEMVKNPSSIQEFHCALSMWCGISWQWGLELNLKHICTIFCLAASAVSELLLPGVTQRCPIGTLNYARAGITCWIMVCKVW